MSGWNEDNFLEQMMPELREKRGLGLCPDAETLGAVIDGTAADAVKNAVAEHTAQCPACAALDQRLRLFARATVPLPEGEWRQSEKRLDDWMQGFLQPPVSAPSAWWRNVFTWKMQWVLVPASALLLAGGILWMMRSPRPVEIAVGAPVAGRPPAAVADIPAPLRNPAAETPNLSETKSPDAGTAGQASPPAESNPAPASQAQGGPPAAEPEQVEAAATPLADPESPAHAAPPASVPGSTALVSAAAPPARPAMARPGPQPAALPASVRINAGTRVWILLESTTPQNNGDFTFRGMVLLPVTEAGAVLLERETEVIGIGKVSQGRTTVRIVEFVRQGAHYRLRGANRASNTPSAAAGPAVEFNAGQVLETWLASVSTYERTPGGTSPPQG